MSSFKKFTTKTEIQVSENQELPKKAFNRVLSSKKDKIIALFNSIEWSKSLSQEDIKIFTDEDFEKFGLYGKIENSSQFCDVIYARNIFQQMRHRVLIGFAFHIYKDKFIKRKKRNR